MTENLLTEPILRMLVHPDTNKVLSVVSPEGRPHSIIAGSFLVDEDGLIYVGEVFMYRSAKYLEANPDAEFLVWKGKDGYSIKATAIDHIFEGPKLEKMNQLLEKKNMHASALWVFRPTEVWDESASSTSGDRIA